MKKIAIIGAIILLVLAVFVLVNKKDSSGEINKPIKIGALLSLSGAAASFGEADKNAMELAVGEINKAGGVGGRKVELVVEDDHTDTKSAVSGFNKLVSVDKVDAVAGGVFDFLAQAVIPLADTNKVVFISPTNNRIEGGLEFTTHTFSLMTDFKNIIRELRGYLEKSPKNKLAVVHFQSTFGHEIAKTLGDVMNELGKPAVIDESYTQIGGNDFKTLISKLKSQNVEVVFLDMVGGDVVNFLSRSRELGFKPQFIGYSSTIDAFADKGADRSLLEGVVILNWEFSGEEFSKRYIAKYGVNPAHSNNKAYDSIYVLSEAIARSEGRENVADYITKNTFKTINGEIKFNKNHTLDNTAVKVTVINNGVEVNTK